MRNINVSYFALSELQGYWAPDPGATRLTLFGACPWLSYSAPSALWAVATYSAPLALWAVATYFAPSALCALATYFAPSALQACSAKAAELDGAGGEEFEFGEAGVGIFDDRIEQTLKTLQPAGDGRRVEKIAAVQDVGQHVRPDFLNR